MVNYIEELILGFGILYMFILFSIQLFKFFVMFFSICVKIGMRKNVERVKVYREEE